MAAHGCGCYFGQKEEKKKVRSGRDQYKVKNILRNLNAQRINQTRHGRAEHFGKKNTPGILLKRGAWRAPLKKEEKSKKCQEITFFPKRDLEKNLGQKWPEMAKQPGCILRSM